jgi:hypothetical protein
MANESEQDRLSELSLHYDTLLWTVTSLWAAAIGGLLVYCWEDQKFSARLAVLGIALTDLAMYFAFSFRVLRRRVYDRMKELKMTDHNLYVSGFPRWLRQWDMFAYVFLALLVLWTWRLIEQRPDCWGAWIILGAVALGILFVLWRLGGKGPKKSPETAGAAGA